GLETLLIRRELGVAADDPGGLRRRGDSIHGFVELGGVERDGAEPVLGSPSIFVNHGAAVGRRREIHLVLESPAGPEDPPVVVGLGIVDALDFGIKTAWIEEIGVTGEEIPIPEAHARVSARDDKSDPRQKNSVYASHGFNPFTRYNLGA